MQGLRSSYRIPFPLSETSRRPGTFDTYFYDYLYFNTVLAFCVVAFYVFYKKKLKIENCRTQKRTRRHFTLSFTIPLLHSNTFSDEECRISGILRCVVLEVTGAQKKHHPNNPMSLPRRRYRSRSVPRRH